MSLPCILRSTPLGPSKGSFPRQFDLRPRLSRLSAKNRRVERREELSMQRLGCYPEIPAVDDHANVQQGCPLRNHAHVYLAESPENTRSHARCVPDVVSHGTENGLV